MAPRRFGGLSAERTFETDDAPEVVLDGVFAEAIGVSALPDAATRPPEQRWPALVAGDRDGALNGENAILCGTTLAGLPGDHRHGLVPLWLAQRLLRMEGRVTELVVGSTSSPGFTRSATRCRPQAGRSGRRWGSPSSRRCARSGCASRRRAPRWRCPSAPPSRPATCSWRCLVTLGSTLAALWPTLRASRLRPVEALSSP